MNSFALISLFIFFLSFYSLVYVASRNIKPRINQIFILLAFCLCWWSFGEFMMRMSSDIRQAVFWANMQALGWAWVASLFFHFSMLFARMEDWIRSKVIYTVLYIPPLAFYYFLLFTNLIYGLKVPHKIWGFSTPEARIGYLVYSSYLIMLLMISFVVVLNVAIKGAFRVERKQAWLIVFGLSLTAITGLATDLVLPSFGFKVFEMGSISTLATLGMFFYAIVRYEFMGITSEREARTIFDSLANLLIVVDPQLRIMNINRRAGESLGYSAEELRGKSVLSLLGDDSEKLLNSLKKVTRGTEAKGILGSFKTKNSAGFPVLVSCGAIRDEGDVVGAVVAARDMGPVFSLIEEIKSANQDLAVRVKELERWKRLTLGREKRLLELDQEFACITKKDRV
jgi:PAS domain S-box-containing protein